VKVVIAGGGTGGHFFPGLAVAQALKERRPETRVLFVGGRRGIESRLAPRYGLDLVALPVSGFVGLGAAGKLTALFRLGAALVACLWLCAAARPDMVVGVGGYASLPMGLAAFITGTPLILLEQNVAPGLTNRILGRLAGAVVVAFEETTFRFRGKAVLLGNPVRKDLASVPSEHPPQHPFRLLVFGGSRGARAVNDVMIHAAPVLKDFPGGIELYLQTGEGDLERVRNAYRDSGLDSARVEPFIDDMAKAYAWCHAVLCRSGATTLAELKTVGRPSLLVPFPHAAGGHQEKNARGLAGMGGALWEQQECLTTTALLKHLRTLADPEVRRPMAETLRRSARPNAAEDIADLILRTGGAA
jgi:UDP-N-acetylglucosamine--N-acetylmuramyl-(pentapeptide) pyrophosphoryl-undecaprenol N-acetylglucosamine transferase